jgi:ribosome-associated protein
MMRLDKVTRAAFDALEDIKARDIQVYDVKKMTAIFDKVIVATGDSNRQCRALANRVQEMVKAAGGKIVGIEGERTGEWVLVDIGAAVIHIMQPAIRQYYNLEELWTPPPKAAKAAKAARAAKAVDAAKPSATRKKSALPAKPRAPRARRAPPA